MALNWSPKAPGDVRLFSWEPPIADGDGLYSFTATVSDGDAVIDSSGMSGNVVSLYISGGTVPTTIDLEAVTFGGETLTETGYLAIEETTVRLGKTAGDIVDFALRKVFGNGATADADAVADALDRLNDMLALWRVTGADTGVALPLLQETELLIPDAFLSGIRHNLTVDLFDHYGVPVTPILMQNARIGLAAIKNALVPSERTAEYY